MTSGVLLRDTVAACVIVATAIAAAGLLAGHPSLGFGLAAGVMVGSLSGYLIQGLMSRGTPFVASSLFRIVFFSSLVLVAAFVLRPTAWTIPMGIAVAQLVMVAVGLRLGIRA